MPDDLLRLVSLEKRFGGLRATDDVSFKIPSGEVVAIVGPNGSGKTTLMNLISGSLKPTRGQILLGGRDITALTSSSIARSGVGRTFQLVRIMPEMTVRENVALGAMFAAQPTTVAECAARTETTLRQVGMLDGWDRKAAAITYLDQKRVELARAMIAAPRLLLLDEWLAGLNPTELGDGIALIRNIAETGVTIVLIEHVMYAVHALASRCIVMNAGRVIADDAPAVALANPEVIAAYLGDDDAAT